MATGKKHNYPANRKASSFRADPGEGIHQRFLSHNLDVASLATEPFDITKASPAETRERVRKYFELCAQHDVRANLAGLGLAFGVSRTTIYGWANGKAKGISKENIAAIKTAYQILNAEMEDIMLSGKVHPVSGIFLMKNNWDYEDKKNVTVTAGDPLGDAVSEDTLREKYLSIAQESTPSLTDKDSEDPGDI